MGDVSNTQRVSGSSGVFSVCFYRGPILILPMPVRLRLSALESA